jgi:hypothetical protein
MPEESGPGGWEVAVDGFADETRGRHEPERSAVTAGGFVVAADLETGWENCHHPLDEQPRGLDRVVQGDDVADQRTARAYDDQPITVGECRQHARALDLYPSKARSRHRDHRDHRRPERGTQAQLGEHTTGGPRPCPIMPRPGIR